MNLQVQRLREDARLPQYATDGAAGLDLFATLDHPITLAPGDTAKVRTGIAIALPKDHEGQVRPRSGLAARFGVTVLNAPGTIDEDYRGEVAVLLINLGRESFQIETGMRIAQLIVAPVCKVRVIEASGETLGKTQRGDGGFGSTGT